LPIPTAWEPCPGKVNAAVIGAPLNVPNPKKVSTLAPKDTAQDLDVKLRRAFGPKRAAFCGRVPRC
jgi:hypothetical protein